MNHERVVLCAGLSLALITVSCANDTGLGDASALEAALEADPHAAHTAAASGGMAMGPYIDPNAALPDGEPGSDHPEIGRTSERPGASDGVGAFRTVCDFSHMNYDDPIVFPGQPGKAHLHAHFGNTLTDADTTAENLRNSGNSTCRGGTANRTAYWVPAVIDRNGKPV